MAITEELRDYVGRSTQGLVRSELMAIADRIDTAHADDVLAAVTITRSKVGETHMRLPVDADGVPCRMDDSVWLDGEPFEVIAITHKGKLALRQRGGKGVRWVFSGKVTHEEPLTVEGVLRGLLSEYDDAVASNLVDFDALYGKYGALLRLAGDGR